MPDRSQLSLCCLAATVAYDANPFLHELPDWQQIMSELPEDAVDTIILQLINWKYRKYDGKLST